MNEKKTTWVKTNKELQTREKRYFSSRAMRRSARSRERKLLREYRRKAKG